MEILREYSLILLQKKDIKLPSISER